MSTTVIAVGCGRIALNRSDNSAWLSSQSQGFVDLNR
jgi:hypothetical protein